MSVPPSQNRKERVPLFHDVSKSPMGARSESLFVETVDSGSVARVDHRVHDPTTKEALGGQNAKLIVSIECRGKMDHAIDFNEYRRTITGIQE
jgi:hypothetical protein